MSTRTAAGRLAVGAVCLAVAGAGLLAPGPARAAAAPGSGFFSLGLLAESGGQRVIFSPEATGQPPGAAEADVPFAQAQLTGSLGRALSSVAWPGALAGNLGTLIVISGGPEQARALNDPVRAQAQSTSGPSKVTNDSVPGAAMTAQATDALVRADAVLGGDRSSGLGSFGSTRATSVTRTSGPTAAAATATSTVQDVAIPAAQLKVSSVVSKADARTDGARASATGSTVVTGMSIAGVPVSVDSDGVSAAGQGTSLAPVASVVNQALANAQAQVFLTDPRRSVKGGTASYDAGSLVVSLGNGAVIVVLGGAKASAAATRSSPLDLTVAPLPVVPPAPPAAAGGAPPAASAGATGGAPALPASGPAPVGGAGVGPPPQVAGATPAAAGSPLRLPGGLDPLWLALALVGAALTAAGLRRLADRVLCPPGTACPLQER